MKFLPLRWPMPVTAMPPASLKCHCQCGTLQIFRRYLKSKYDLYINIWVSICPCNFCICGWYWRGDQHPAQLDQDPGNSSSNILLQKWNGRLSPHSSPPQSQEVEVSLEIWGEHKNNIGDEKTDPCSKLAMLDPSLSSGDVSGKYLSILDSALRGEGWRVSTF